jgi:hypothetical protein
MLKFKWVFLSFFAGYILGVASPIVYVMWDALKIVSGGNRNDDTTRTIKRI